MGSILVARYAGMMLAHSAIAASRNATSKRSLRLLRSLVRSLRPEPPTPPDRVPTHFEPWAFPRDSPSSARDSYH